MRLRALLLAVPLIVLAACSSGTDSTSTSSSGTGASGSASAVPTLGPSVPPATAVAAPVPADQLPTATGAFGEKPTLTFPAGNPVPSLQRVILSEGTGPVTVKGDWLITNYLGQVWGGEVFDNSYDRGTTSAFQIGAGKVVPGWDTALVGVPVGSRVMLSLPPADGYGSAGNSSAGIKGTDTLVFVVDIVDAVGAERRWSDRCHRADPAGQCGRRSPARWVVRQRSPCRPVPRSRPRPWSPCWPPEPARRSRWARCWCSTPRSPGPGKTPGPPGTSDDPTASGTGPQELPVATGGPFAGLVGVPLGSRVLVQVPGQTDQSTGQPSPAIAAVVDLLVQTVTTPG